MKSKRTFQYLAVAMIALAWTMTFKSSRALAVDTAQVVSSNFINLHVAPDSTIDQTETSIAVSRLNPMRIVVGANSRPNPNRPISFVTADGGLAWDNDTVLDGVGAEGLDPTVAFNSENKAFYAFRDETLIPSRTVIRAAIRDSTADDWESPVLISGAQTDVDKPWLTIDQTESAYKDNIYVAWSGGSHNFPTVYFNSSTDSGDHWGTHVDISSDVSAGTSLGVNLAVGYSGYVYAVWGKRTNALGEIDALVLNRAMGGENWRGAEIIVDSVNGIRESTSSFLSDKSIKAGTIPSLAVDTNSSGEDILYLVWAEETSDSYPEDADIFFTTSSDSGETWTTPLRVNDDSFGNGKDQWLPWVSVDPSGGINIVYYDCRNSEDNDKVEVWMARSVDGGQSFGNFRVGEYQFDAAGVIGGGAYFGEYIGMASSEDYLFPCWFDSRWWPDGRSEPIYQVQVGVIPLDGTDTLSGTIASNSTWKSIYLTDDITIDSGVTVTVNSWTKIMAKHRPMDPVYITVKGNLVIEGGKCWPVFTSESREAGSWGGLILQDGGALICEGDNGCIIENATVGILVDSTAADSTLRHVTVYNSETEGIRVLNGAVRVARDTVFATTEGSGIAVQGCGPIIESCYVAACSTGVYALESSAELRGNVIWGPGKYGINISKDTEYPGNDTVILVDNSVMGYYSVGHLYANEYGHCTIDSCLFNTFPITCPLGGGPCLTDGPHSPYGIQVASNSNVTMRRSEIHNWTTVGFYSGNSNADLGTDPDSGLNSIYPDDPEETWYYVFHSIDLGFGAEGGGPPIFVGIKAEGNYWFDSSPDAENFVGTDYTPWLTAPPSYKTVVAEYVEQSSIHPELNTRSFPNPFNPSTTIEFNLNASSRTTVTVYNILGQQVKKVLDHYLEAGLHETVWDGSDDRGRAVSSGVYLYRITTDTESTSRKMVLLR